MTQACDFLLKLMEAVESEDSILRLPYSISFQAAALWSELRDLGRLDSAYCCSVRRPQFLNLLASDEFIVPKLPETNGNTFQCILEWLIKRRVKVATLYFPTGVKVCKECPCEDLFKLIGPELRSVHFDWSVGSTPTFMRLIATHCKKLREYGMEFSTMTSEFRDVLKSNNELAQTTGNTLMNDAAAHAIATNCAHLQALNLTGCNRISESAVIVIFTACTTLTEIDISSCDKLTNQSIFALTKHCKQMQKILLQRNNRYTDDALLAIADAYFETLRLLYIGDCENVSSTGITAVAQRCTSLACLDIGAIPYIETAALMAVSVHNLTELVLSFLDVTDPVLISVARNCRQLTILHMYHTQGFAVHGIYAVVTRCLALKELLVNEDSDIVTPRTVQRFANWNPALVVITANYLLGCGALD